MGVGVGVGVGVCGCGCGCGVVVGWLGVCGCVHIVCVSCPVQIHCDLVQVATRGAMLVVDGFIPALNPGDEEK